MMVTARKSSRQCLGCHGKKSRRSEKRRRMPCHMRHTCDALQFDCRPMRVLSYVIAMRWTSFARTMEVRYHGPRVHTKPGVGLDRED